MPKKFSNQCFYYNPETQLCSPARTSLDDIYFQSNYEFQVYKTIVQTVGRNRLQLQFPLRIKPHSDRFPVLWWKVDFAILDPSRSITVLYVEAKGLNPERNTNKNAFNVKDFKTKIQYLDYFLPEEYKKLILATEDSKLSFPNVDAVPLIRLRSYLQERLSK